MTRFRRRWVTTLKTRNTGAQIPLCRRISLNDIISHGNFSTLKFLVLKISCRYTIYYDHVLPCYCSIKPLSFFSASSTLIISIWLQNDYNLVFQKHEDLIFLKLEHQNVISNEVIDLSSNTTFNLHMKPVELFLISITERVLTSDFYPYSSFKYMVCQISIDGNKPGF